MSEPTEEPLAPRPQTGFPLASLALLVTVFACVLASADIDRLSKQLVWFDEHGNWRLIALVGAASVFGGLIGFIYMFGGIAGWRGRKMAPLAGLLAGAAGVLILLAPGAVWRTILAVSVLLTTVILIRIDTD